MKHPFPAFKRRNSRTFIATLLSYLLLAGHFAPLASGAARTSPRPHAPAGVETPAGATATAAAPVPAPLAAPLAAASLSVTKVDSFPDPDNDGKANPGDTITYTLTVTNNGNMDATNVTVSDTVDPNTTIVGGSVVATPLGNNDTYNVIGNVRIQPNSSQGVLANDRDTNSGNTGAGAGLTASGPNSGPSNGQLTLNSDGSFSYNPNPGFNGTDTFTYTVTDSGGRTGTATVTLNVGDGNGGTTGVIWFVQDGAAAGGDGRLTSPFNCYTGATANCFSQTAADEAGDAIFLLSGNYTGGNALLNTQELVGQGATDTLATIAAVTVQPYSDPLPTTGGTNPVITTSAAATNGVTLAQGNTLRGFTVGATTGAKIFGNNFGTLTVGKLGSPDVALSGAGQALNLTNGTFAATSAFASVATTSSAAQGITLTTVAGTVNFGSTAVSGSTTQGILIQQSTADINFGNTSVSGGTDGISLQNNSSGTRTFGTLTRNLGTGAGFLHAVGGGAVNVTGATSITNTGGTGISINASNANITFAATSVDKGGNAGTCVSIISNAGRTTTFTSLDLNSINAAGVGLLATTGGTINVTNAAGSEITTPQLIDINVATLSLNFTQLASTNGPAAIPAVRVIGASGSLSSTSTNIQNPGNAGLSIDGNSAAFNFGNTTSNSSAGPGVFLNNNTGAITFADLDITPDSTFRGLDAQNNTGTITSSSGDIAATGAAAVFIDGPAGRTPLAMTLNNVDSTNSTAQGVSLTDVSGNFTVNDATLATNIQNSTGNGVEVVNAGSGAISFGNTTVNGSGNANGDDTGTGIVLTNNLANISFGALTVTPDSGERGLLASDTDAASAAGLLTISSGTVTTTNDTAIQITGASAAARTPLNVQLTTVNTTGGATAANGIALTNTSASGSPGGFRVLGNGGTCTFATPTCTGGRITNTAGAGDLTAEDNGGIGVRLHNANQVFLTRMRIDNHNNFAVYGRGVIGFNLDASVIDGTNGDSAATDDAAISFHELTGTTAGGTASSITNSFIGGGREFLIAVNNFASGSLDRLTVSNNTIGDLDGAGAGIGLHQTDGDDALQFNSTAAGSTLNVSVLNNVINVGRGDVVNYNAGNGGTHTGNFVLRGNTMHNTHPQILSGGGGVTVTFGGPTNHTGSYEIACNSIRFSKGFGLLVAKSGTGSSGTVAGTIFNNRIGVDGTAGSGSAEASGMNVDSRGGGTHNVLIKNNQVHEWGANGAYQIFNNQGNVTMNVTVQGNLSNNPHPANALAGLYAEVGALSGDTSVLNLLVGGAGAAENNFVEGDPFNGNDVLLSRIAGAGTTFNLSRGVSGASSVQQIITDNNVDPVTAAGAGTINFVNTTPTLPPAINESCTPPSAPAEADVVNPDSPGTGVIEENSGGDTGAPQTATNEGGSADDNVTSRPFVGLPQSGSNTAAGQPSGGLGVVYNQDGGAPAPVSGPPAGGESEPASDDLPAPRPPVINGDNITFDLGTIPAGKSITVTFQVVVDDPFTSQTPQVSNQATVTADGGISVLSDDPSEAGTNNPTVTLINATQAAFSIRDAKVGEPSSGSTPMVFTVALAAPAGSTVTVDYATADDVGGTNPATGGATCDGTVDYETASGTVTFMAGQMLRTISVNVCADANNAETDETFLVNLSNPTGGTIVDAQAVGTINPTSQPGLWLISELRTSGPLGAGDEFVEVFNNTGTDQTVAASDASPGFGIFKMGADCDATPVLVGTIPNGTVIQKRGHFLIAGGDYSLNGAAGPDASMSGTVEDDADLAIFSTTDPAMLSTATRLDGVGFGTNTGSVCDLLREGNTMPKALGSTSEYSFVRKQDTATGNPLDTNVNSNDFQVVSTTPATPVGDNAAPKLGAPGPENNASPRVKSLGSEFGTYLLAPCVGPAAVPNRVRDTTPGDPATSSLGTLSFRRTYHNLTGVPVTRLRFRIVDMTTFPSPGGTADLRAITSSQIMVTTPCGGGNLTVEGTTLETPPAQPNGGGINSTLSAGTITLGSPLVHNQTINLQFLMGVQQLGTFRFLVIIEALP